MNVVRRLGLLAWLALALPASAFPPQGGYTTEKHPEHGLTFPRARHYEAIPTQPIERSVVLRFAEKESQARKKKRRGIPQMWIVRMDHEASADDDELPGTFDEYLELRMEGWKKGELLDQEEKKGWEGSEYELGHSKSKLVAGWAYVWQKPGVRTFVVAGYCHKFDIEEQQKIWRHTARKMKFAEPTSASESRDRAKWDRYYERRDFIDPEHRIRVRLSLTDGWKAEDTENYIVVFNTPDQPLLRRVMRDLEIIRKEYEKLFPSVAPVEAVSTVRICEDRTEYLQYGGTSGSAGYWSSMTEELVLYDATKQPKGERKDRRDTYHILYHEAFHQYIHYSAGELAPHSWFNEGNGDYFSGAIIKSGKVQRIGPNSWRVRTIKNAVHDFSHVPWKEIIRYEKKEYYANPYLCYAQGWSMVYFLNTSKEAREHPLWSKILTTYFEELKDAWTREELVLAKKKKEPSETVVEAAQKRARVRAAEVAFSDVDLDELERAWIAFVEDL